MATKRNRTVRREGERALKKDVAARIALAKMEPGGAPSRPISVVSASVVEPHALALPCILCDSTDGRLVDHVVSVVQGELLRKVTTRCFTCGSNAERWFRIAPPQLN